MKNSKITTALFFTFSILITSICSAEPIYLDCETKGEDSRNFAVKLDEANGKITHTRSGGYAFNAEGFFSANKVTYQHIDLVGVLVKITDKFEIDRSDLSIVNITSMESVPYPDKVPSEVIEVKGSCKVVSIKKRKI
jgi:hypothetical protein